jgi:hypothetical protein
MVGVIVIITDISTDCENVTPRPETPPRDPSPMQLDDALKHLPVIPGCPAAPGRPAK